MTPSEYAFQRSLEKMRAQLLERELVPILTPIIQQGKEALREFMAMDERSRQDRSQEYL